MFYDLSVLLGEAFWRGWVSSLYWSGARPIRASRVRSAGRSHNGFPWEDSPLPNCRRHHSCWRVPGLETLLEALYMGLC